MAEPSTTHSAPLIENPSVRFQALNTKPRKEGRKFSRIDSIKDILADGDGEKKFLLKKVEENMNYLNIEILKEQQQHILTSLHFQCLHNWALFVPSMLLTSFSSILAIFGGSRITLAGSPATSNDLVLVFIAVLGIASAFIQSLMKQLNFSGRGMAHETCATQLRKLLQHIKLSRRNAQYNSIYKALQTGEKLTIGENFWTASSQFDASLKATDNDDDDNDDDDNDDGSKIDGLIDGSFKGEPTDTEGDSVGADLHPTLEQDTTSGSGGNSMEDQNEGKEGGFSIVQQFQQAIESCKDPYPHKIAAAFNLLDSRIDLVNKSMLEKDHGGHNSQRIKWFKIKPALYHTLTETIVSSRMWPLHVPNAEWSVNQTFAHFRKILRCEDDNMNFSIIDEIIKRSAVVDDLGDCITPAPGRRHTTRQTMEEMCFVDV